MCMYSHILLLEDDFDDRDFFLEVLGEINPSITFKTTESGFQALQMLEKLPPDTTLIFLDLNLPLMSGKEFLKVIKTSDRYSDIPVIVLTTSTNDERPCKKLGASLYVTKPSSVDLMRNTLSIILNNDIATDSEFVEGLLAKQQPSR
jgi:CheY-like chemotaxis protein